MAFLSSSLTLGNTWSTAQYLIRRIVSIIENHTTVGATVYTDMYEYFRQPLPRGVSSFDDNQKVVSTNDS